MRSFEVMCDVSSDMNHELREKFGIYDDYVRSDLMLPNGKVIEADTEWTGLDPVQYFESMRKKKVVYKSAVKGVDHYIEKMRKPLSEGSDLLCVTLSGNMSATYGLFNQAKEVLQKEFPERKIFIVDSLRYSTAEGLMAMYAAKLRDEGKTIEETAKWLDDNKYRFHQMGPLDDLFFLHKSGRISFAKAFFGSLIGIMPMGDFNHLGRTTILGKAKGYKNSLRATIEYIKATIEDSKDQTIFIAHTNRLEKAQKLKEMIEQEIECKEVVITMVGSVCGANIGPGLVAAYYVGKQISDDCVEETEIMKGILAKL